MSRLAISTHYESLGRVLSLAGEDTGQFQVPEFQRNYRWGAKEWDEFWQDVVAIVDRPAFESPHFLGTVVVEKRTVGHFDVFRLIDGQQRLTTCVLLACELAAAALPFDQNLQRQIRATLYRDGDLPDGRRPVLLSKDVDVKPLLAAMWVPGHSPVPGSPISDACTYFRSELQKKFGSADAVRQFWTRFKQRLSFVVIVISGEPLSFVYRVFEDLNTKGKDLSPVDVIRNFVLMNTEDSPARVATLALWSRTEAICNAAVAEADGSDADDDYDPPSVPTAVRAGVTLLEDAFYNWTAVRHGDAFNPQTWLSKYFEKEVVKEPKDVFPPDDAAGVPHYRTLQSVARSVYAAAVLRRPDKPMLVVDGYRQSLADLYTQLGYVQGNQTRRGRLPGTADPLLMHLLTDLAISSELADAGTIHADAATRDNVGAALDRVESWFWRRMFAFGSATIRKRNRPFFTLGKKLLADDDAELNEEQTSDGRLRVVVAKFKGSDAWPLADQIAAGVARPNSDWKMTTAHESLRYLEARLAGVVNVAANRVALLDPPTDAHAGDGPPLTWFVLLTPAVKADLDVADEPQVLAAVAASPFRTTRLAEPGVAPPAFATVADYLAARAAYLTGRVDSIWP